VQARVRRFVVAPVKAFGFAKGEPFGQTRFCFAS
jgi:hypothetical protein